MRAERIRLSGFVSHLSALESFIHEINPQTVKQLREKTNAGFMDCKRALTEGGGDLDSRNALRTKGIASASKKSSRATRKASSPPFTFGGKVGVLVEVNCETDFVAERRLRAFVKDILHIAAAQPLYVSRDEVPAATLIERAIYTAQVKASRRM